MPRNARDLARRATALFVSASMLATGCGPAFLEPVAGVAEYRRFGLIPVPGGVFDAAGVNLWVERLDLSLDTPVWTHSVGAVYSSATSRWFWSHETHYDGARFVDPSGAVHDVSGIAFGNAIPGTVWVVVSPTAIRSKGGRVYGFDAEGRLDHLAWDRTPYPRIQYLWGEGGLRTHLCPSPALPAALCPPLFHWTLGPAGPLQVEDERSGAAGGSRVALYEYDGWGRLIGARTPFEVTRGLPGTRYGYRLLFSLLTSIESSEGERIEYRWGGSRRLARVTQVGAGDPTHRFDYAVRASGAFRYEVLHTNPVGGETRVRFDALRRVSEVTLVTSGESKAIGWPAEAVRPESIRDFDGATRRYLAWQGDDPIRIQEPSGNVVEVSYQPDAIDFAHPSRRPIHEVRDSLGPISTTEFDALGRPRTHTDATGAATLSVYSSSALESTSFGSGATTLYSSYGVHGHWLSAERSDQPEQPLRRRFDVVGNLQVAAAGLQRGGLLDVAHDADRRVASLQVAATDGSGSVVAEGVIAIERRSDGQISRVTSPHGGEESFEYDALGRPWRHCRGVGASCRNTEFSHDALGRIVAVEQPNGMREEIVRDAYGRVVARRFLRDGEVEASATVVWAAGHPVATYDSVRDQWSTAAYDAAGRVRRLDYSGYGESLELEYDLRSRVTRETWSVGSAVRTIGREWDGANRQIRVFAVDPGGQEQNLLQREYTDGNLVRVTYGNGLVRETLRDPETGRLLGFATTHPTLGVVEQTTVESAALLDPKRLEVSTETTTPLASTREVYWLEAGGSLSDPNGRVGRRVFRWLAFEGGVLAAQRSYAWDERSNPASAGGGESFAYDAERNHLLEAQGSFGAHTYAYDEAGYATERDGLAIAWNAAGRLASIGPTASPLVAIEWDTASRPVSVEVLGVRRELALFGGALEIDLATGALGWLDLGEISLPFEGAERRFRHRDFLRNVSFVSDETGDVVTHNRYAPFGVDAVHGEGAFAPGSGAGFVGGTTLPGTGLTLLGVRILDADVGRFLSPDPVWSPINAYTYAFGNPVFFWDPDGRHAQGKFEAARVRLEGANTRFTNAVVASMVAGVALAAAVGATLKSPARGAAGTAAAFTALSVAVSEVSASHEARNRAEDQLAAAFQSLIRAELEGDGQQSVDVSIPLVPEIPAPEGGCVASPRAAGLPIGPAGDTRALALLFAALTLISAGYLDRRAASHSGRRR